MCWTCGRGRTMCKKWLAAGIAAIACGPLAWLALATGQPVGSVVWTYFGEHGPGRLQSGQPANMNGPDADMQLGAEEESELPEVIDLMLLPRPSPESAEPPLAE